MLKLLLRAALLLAALSTAGDALAATDAFNGGAVSNCTYDSPTQTYSCTALSTSNNITIASGYTVVLTGSINFGYNQQLNMSGSAKLQTTGSLDIGNISPSNLNITGGTLAAGTTFSVGAQAQTLSANITAASMNIGTGSTTRITGSLTSTGSVTVASNVTITGPISGTTVTLLPASISVTGDISATTSLTIGSGNHVTGNVSGGSLTIQPSNAGITGNVTLTGDVDLGSGDTITGNLVAHNVKTEDSDGYISGNASVNGITLGWHGRVGGTITCTATGASNCSCVTNNSGYTLAPNAPVCSAGSGGLDHILITHSGSALTCQPQTVTLTACANSACTAPNYSGSVTVALSPGGGNVTISGGTNTSATVAQTTAGTATLSTSIGGAVNSQCLRTSDNTSSCAMVFSSAGFVFNVPDQFASTGASFTLQALKQGSNAATCIPALSGTQNITFTCAYVNPSSSAPGHAVPVVLGSSNNTSIPLAANSTSACSAVGVSVPVTFTNGQATIPVSYADAGQMQLGASFSQGGNTTLTGSDSFIVAPAKFAISVANNPLANVAQPTASSPVFTRAGQNFSTTMTAYNANNGITYNFGRESSPESFQLSNAAYLPASGNAPFTSSAFSSVVNGSATAQQVHIDDVGIFTLTGSLLSNGYLGSSLKPTGSTYVGRIIPDHFGIVLGGASFMSCGTLLAACPAPNNTSTGVFLYSMQPFDMTVTAYNAQNGVTSNYAGAFAKAISGSVVNAAGTALGNVSIGWKSSSGIAANGIQPAQFAAGIANTATITTSGGTQYNSHPEIDVAKTAPLTGYVIVTDTDGAASVVAPQALLSAVSGQMLIDNGFGSLNSTMPVKFTAQYYNGAAFVLNPAYIASNVPLASPPNISGLKVISCVGKGNTACPGAAALLSNTVNLTFSKGVSIFSMAPMGNAGWSDIQIDSTYFPLIYLPSGVARLTFGVYKSGPVIYTREVF